jgi:hypothetical protein
MGRTARYLVAQHVADLFRNEPTNVGVFVEIGVERTSRFVGETMPGKIDGRLIKRIPYPDVYRQWVEYWNAALSSGADAVAELLKTSGQHYRVVDGGEVADVGDDSVLAVANFLYMSLVDEAGLAKSLGGEEVEISSIRLQQDILDQFESLNILSNDGVPERAKRPILRNAMIKGKTTSHKPEFYQENGHAILMEPIDLTTGQRISMRDHAGWASFMFSDVRQESADAEAIAIIRATAESERDKQVSYAMEMLHGTASRVVNWLSDQERDAFLNERTQMAQVE